MGIILKCGDNCVLYNSYELWNLFKIELFRAVKIFLDQFINHVSVQDPLKLENELIGFEQSERITSYLIYTMKNIECLKILKLEGIYHLLIISNKRGFYAPDKSEKICRTIDLVYSHINTEKLNITPYMHLFETSSTNKKPIYIL